MTEQQHDRTGSSPTAAGSPDSEQERRTDQQEDDRRQRELDDAELGGES